MNFLRRLFGLPEQPEPRVLRLYVPPQHYKLGPVGPKTIGRIARIPRGVKLLAYEEDDDAHVFTFRVPYGVVFRVPYDCRVQYAYNRAAATDASASANAGVSADASPS